MHTKFKHLITKYWLLFYFIILFVLMLIFRISLEDIWKTISSLELWQLCVLLAAFFLISYFRIWTRKYLLFALNFSCRFTNLTRIHFSSMAAHYSTPVKIGYPLTVYLLKRFENVPYIHGTATVLIELTVSTSICGVLAVLGGFIYFRDHALLFFLILIGVILSGVITIWGSRRFSKKRKRHSQILNFFSDFSGALSRIALSRMILYSSMMVLIQIFSSVPLLLLCYFFSSDLSILQAVTAGSTAFFVGAISMIPMGLGTRDAAMLFYLKLFGIPGDVGIAIVTIQRLLFTGLSFLLGVLFGIFLGVQHIVPHNHMNHSDN